MRYRSGVGRPVQRAVGLWTQSAGVWWPVAAHSASSHRDPVLVIEPGADDRIDKQAAGGDRFSRGMVLVLRGSALPGGVQDGTAWAQRRSQLISR